LDPPKIEIRRLTYEVGGTEILAGVDALVPDGEITAVVGSSGAVKSTLLRAINRLAEPTSGEVYLDGEATGSLDPLELRRRVGMVFQIPALFGASVEEKSGHSPGTRERAPGVACNALVSPQDEPGGSIAGLGFAMRPPGTLYTSSGR
jgi:ABC-type iron transport system FetAB ATPase subunit